MNSALLLLTYYLNLNNLKKESEDKISLVKSGVLNDYVTTLRISKNDIKDPNLFNEINEKEFIYCGSLYDIISRTWIGDTIVIVCINDVNEEKFHRDFAKSNIPNGGKFCQNRNYRIIYPLNLLPVIFQEFELNKYLCFQEILPGNEPAYYQNFVDVPSPPPKFS